MAYFLRYELTAEIVRTNCKNNMAIPFTNISNRKTCVKIFNFLVGVCAEVYVIYSSCRFCVSSASKKLAWKAHTHPNTDTQNEKLTYVHVGITQRQCWHMRIKFNTFQNKNPRLPFFGIQKHPREIMSVGKLYIRAWMSTFKSENLLK